MDWFIGKGVELFYQQYAEDIKQMYIYCKFLDLTSFHFSFVVAPYIVILMLLFVVWVADKSIIKDVWEMWELKSKNMLLRMYLVGWLALSIGLCAYAYHSMSKIHEYAHDHKYVTTGMIHYAEVNTQYKALELMSLGDIIELPMKNADNFSSIQCALSLFVWSVRNPAEVNIFLRDVGEIKKKDLKKVFDLFYWGSILAIIVYFVGLASIIMLLLLMPILAYRWIVKD